MKRIMLYCITFLLTAVWTLPVFADQIQEIQDQKEYIDNLVDSINKQKLDEKNKLNVKQSEKNKLVENQKKVETEYQKLTNDIKRINDEVKKIDDEIVQAEEKYDQQRELFKTRLRVMYENSGSSYIEALAQSKTIVDFFDRLELISLIAKKDKNLIVDLNTAKQDIEYKKKLKSDEKDSKQKTATDIQKSANVLQVSRANIDAQIRTIDTKLRQLTAQEDELLRKANELTSQIRALQRNGGKYAGGSMVWPVPSSGNVTSPFGNRLHPILRVYRMHTGIDISASSGVSILSANKGTVILAGWQSGYGNTLIIDHGGGIATLYAHCSALLVGVGQEVEAGSVVAKVGSTGLSTGPHLHFEVRVNGELADPLGYVSP